MGTSTDGILAYGYNLGGDDSGWEVAEADEHGGLELDWLADDPGFTTAAMDKLLAAAGFTETDWQVDGYSKRKKAAEESLGVEFETYCSDDFPMYLLAAKVITVSRGYVEPIDMTELVEAPNVNGWDGKLRSALSTLGLTPKQEKPQWLLCSYWG